MPSASNSLMQAMLGTPAGAAQKDSSINSQPAFLCSAPAKQRMELSWECAVLWELF